MTNNKDYESPTHNSDICINYFGFIFQYVLIFYYFRFIRLLKASNCFIITVSFNDFIHEPFFFFCLRLSVHINTWRAAIVLFGKVNMSSSIFYLIKYFNYNYSILLLIIFFLLFTVHFYNKGLGLMAFLSLHVNSINIKGSFFNKFSIKCCTIP